MHWWEKNAEKSVAQPAKMATLRRVKHAIHAKTRTTYLPYTFDCEGLPILNRSVTSN